MKVKETDTSAGVKEMVRAILKDEEIQVPDLTMDRAHRIGKTKVDNNGNATQLIIIRVTCFRDMSVDYRVGMIISDKYSYGVSFDLTKNRLVLLNEAKEMVKGNKNVNFVYTL